MIFQNNVQICPDLGWEYLNGKCYKLITDKQSWGEAQDHCQTLDAKLAEPQSPCESDLLHYFFQISHPKNVAQDYAWIGINDIGTENTFVFASNGQPVPYTYWKENQPDNFNGNEDCVNICSGINNGRMNDLPCSSASWFIWSICEKTFQHLFVEPVAP